MKNRAILVRPTRRNPLSKYWPEDPEVTGDLQWAFVLWAKGDDGEIFLAGHTTSPDFEADDILFAKKEEETRAGLAHVALNEGNRRKQFEICIFEDTDTPISYCRGARAGRLHPWVCVRSPADDSNGRGLVRVTCTICKHSFEVEFTGLLGGGRMFPVPRHHTTGDMP